MWEECRFSTAMLISLFVIHQFRFDDGVFGFIFAFYDRHAGVGGTKSMPSTVAV